METQVILEIQAEMNVKMDAIQESQERMSAMLDAHHERIMASLGKRKATDFKAIPEEMESVMEHQEIPQGSRHSNAGRRTRKGRRVCNLAAERRHKKKERTRGNRGSRKKSAPSCRKLSRRAKVAWRKRNLFRNVQTQRNCGP
jgi:phosphoribosylformylglycinamidine (FGAM) synthase-like enzyme